MLNDPRPLRQPSGVVMARMVEKLTAIQVRTAKHGRHSDGDGLFLLVKPNSGRFWVFRYRVAVDGNTKRTRMREMGLGSAGEGKGQVSLADARAKAAPLWKQATARDAKDRKDP